MPLGTSDSKNTAYRLQMHELAERFNETIVLELQHTMDEYDQGWNTYEQPLTYSYSDWCNYLLLRHPLS